MEQISLGKILIEINLDTNQYNIGFSNTDTSKLMQQQEVMTLMSPFHVVCIINELKRRHEIAGNKIVPATIIPPSNKAKPQ